MALQPQKPRFSDEFLKLINDAPEGERVNVLRQYGGFTPLNYLLSMNFDENVVCDLPEGMPPYKRDEATHPDLQGLLQSQIKRMANCFKTSSIPKIKKEMLFIQILESIPPQEADVLVHVKDKSLTEMYPNITYDLVNSVFPEYCRKRTW
jgi:hypothetical protein